MKTITTQLADFLGTATQIGIFDLYTFTLIGGSVIRWTNCDQPIIANGHTYSIGPAINRSQLSNKRGVETGTVKIEIFADENDLLQGVPLATALQQLALDGALVRVDRAYFDLNMTLQGTLLWFSGRATKMTLTASTATVEAAGWRILFNVNVPTDLYEPDCDHILGDAGCLVDLADFTATGAINGTSTVLSLATNVIAAATYYSQGTITFTSGANNGQVRSIKSSDSGGGVDLILALPYVPATGDTFSITAGCDYTSATCLDRFNNLIHFGGEEFVPVPEVAVG